MKRLGFGLIVLCTFAISPPVARAALTLQFAGGNGPLTTWFPVGPGPYFVDLAFVETGTPQDEQLFAYDLDLSVSPLGPIRFAGAEKPDNWVFTAPEAGFAVAQSSPTHLLINAVNRFTGPFSDITTGSEAARLFYTVECVPGVSRISFGPDTIFASGDPNQDVVIPVDVSDGGMYTSMCPEPAGLSLLPLAAALALRRRRGAPDTLTR